MLHSLVCRSLAILACGRCREAAWHLVVTKAGPLQVTNQSGMLLHMQVARMASIRPLSSAQTHLSNVKFVMEKRLISKCGPQELCLPTICKHFGLH